MPTPTKKININVTRSNGKTLFQFSVDPAIEEIFKNRAREVRESQSWPGLKFYYLPETETENYQLLVRNYNLFDDFGHALTRSQKFNMAFLRTVGGNGTIEIKEDIPFAQMSMAIRNIAQFIKVYYERFFTDYKVKATVEVEI